MHLPNSSVRSEDFRIERRKFLAGYKTRQNCYACVSAALKAESVDVFEVTEAVEVSLMVEQWRSLIG